jgi:hypothetical protein
MQCKFFQFKELSEKITNDLKEGKIEEKDVNELAAIYIDGFDTNSQDELYFVANQLNTMIAVNKPFFLSCKIITRKWFEMMTHNDAALRNYTTNHFGKRHGEENRKKAN